jgi:hypothetical protein
VWFMSGSLFSKYPYDVPTEAFSFEIFRQAFAAVQASVVHLQLRCAPPALQKIWFGGDVALAHLGPAASRRRMTSVLLKGLCACAISGLTK